jgi:RND family efflux transporter MFP subunit
MAGVLRFLLPLGILRKRWIWGTLALGAALAGTVWIYLQARHARHLSDPSFHRRRGDPIPVRTFLVSQEKMDVTIGGTATTAASKTAIIRLSSATASQGGLTVKAVRVKDGDFVKKDDQPLVEFEDDAPKMAVKQRELAVAAAEVELARARKTLKERDEERRLTVAALEAEVVRLKETPVHKAKERQLAFDAAKAEVERLKEAAPYKDKERQSARAFAEAEVVLATKDMAEKQKLRKVILSALEAEVTYHMEEVETRQQHRNAMKDKKEAKPNEYYEARSKHEKARAELAKGQKELEKAKVEMDVGPLTDQKELARAEKELQKAKNDMTLGPALEREQLIKAQKELQKAVSDMKLGPLLEQEQLAKAEKDLQKARNDLTIGALSDQELVAKALSSLDQAKWFVTLARKELAETRLKAPLSGLVEGLSLTPGMVIKGNTAVANVLQVHPILVKMDYPQERLGDLALGLKAEVVLDGFPGETFEGTVVRIPPTVDAHLRVLPIYIEVANPKMRFRPGISGFVRVRVTKVAPVVPATAVITRGDKSLVFCVQEGRARVREVRLGPPVEAGMLEVQSGLKAGEAVVIYTNFYDVSGSLVQTEAVLQDNDPVDVDWRKWARRHD